MPRKSKKQSQTRAAAATRWKEEREGEDQDQYQEPLFENEVSSVTEVDYEEEKDESDDKFDEKNFTCKLDLPMIDDLFEMCKIL